jgi:hypothetical protein
MRTGVQVPAGKSAQKVGAIIVVATIALAAFVAGRMSSTSRPFCDAAFDRAYESCVESVALEYKDKLQAEFRRAEQEWEAKHGPYRWPVHAAVYRSFERPDLEGYMEKLAATRADYHQYIERRVKCARQGQRR